MTAADSSAGPGGAGRRPAAGAAPPSQAAPGGLPIPPGLLEAQAKMLAPMAQQALASADDPQLARMAEALVGQVDGKGAEQLLRLALYVLGSVCNVRHGFRPERVKVEVLNPTDHETWIPLLPR